nr:MAG TPA: DNA-binding transcriptional regulator [Caudoviricetes sp.]
MTFILYFVCYMYMMMLNIVFIATKNQVKEV